MNKHLLKNMYPKNLCLEDVLDLDMGRVAPKTRTSYLNMAMENNTCNGKNICKKGSFPWKKLVDPLLRFL
jgi:hypothetical protein